MRKRSWSSYRGISTHALPKKTKALFTNMHSRTDTDKDLVQMKVNQTKRNKLVKPSMPKMPWEEK